MAELTLDESLRLHPKEGALQLDPEEEHLSQFFQYKHLPPHLQEISQLFGELAGKLVAKVQCNPERAMALRKLLEAKDCAVRAVIAK